MLDPQQQVVALLGSSKRSRSWMGTCGQGECNTPEDAQRPYGRCCRSLRPPEATAGEVESDLLLGDPEGLLGVLELPGL